MHIQNICDSSDCSLNNAVKINVFCTDIAVSEALDDVMSDFFRPPNPARIRVRVAGLSLNAKVEIDGIFHL